MKCIQNTSVDLLKIFLVMSKLLIMLKEQQLVPNQVYLVEWHFSVHVERSKSFRNTFTIIGGTVLNQINMHKSYFESKVQYA